MKKDIDKDKNQFGTITKVMKILECFSISEPELNVAQISEKVGLPTSSLYRYLQALEKDDFLTHNRVTNTYYLGLRIAELGGIAQSRYDVRRVGQNDLNDLAAKLDMNTTIGILYKGDLFHLAFSLRNEANPWSNIIGRRLPAHQTALGKVLLAHLPFDQVEQIIEQYGWRKSTPNSIDNLEALKIELNKTYRRQYGIDRQESTDSCCLAVPIRGRDGSVTASVSASCSPERFDSEFDKILSSVKKTAVAISYKLGYIGTTHLY